MRFKQLLGTSLMLLLMHRQDGPFLRPSNKPSDPGLGVCAGPQSPYSSSSSPSAPWPEERGDPPVLLEKTEAERDDPHTTKGRASLSKDCFTSRNVRGDGERQRENSVVDKDGDVMESTGDSTTVWSSLELDMNCGRSHKSETCTHNGSVTSSF